VSDISEAKNNHLAHHIHEVVFSAQIGPDSSKEGPDVSKVVLKPFPLLSATNTSAQIKLVR
jgi:hypothetical protein